MPRCKTCREKFIPKRFNQKNCDENEECLQAEIDLKKEAQQKRIDKAKGRERYIGSNGIIKVVHNLSQEEKKEFVEGWGKLNKKYSLTDGRLILINKKPPKPFSAKKSAPKKLSSKQKSIENDYHKTLKEFDENTEPICTGCERYQGGDIKLSHSHIISKADCKRYGRPDLISDPRNITFHCLDFGDNIGCHGRHEQRDKTLLDYEVKLLFVIEICSEVGNNELANKLILK